MSEEPPTGAPATEAPAIRPRPRYSRRVVVSVRALCATASFVLLLASGIAWATYDNFRSSVPHGLSVPSDQKDPDSADQNILLIGNDTRNGATAAELKALHTGNDKGTANADTMMVLHIPGKEGGRPTLVSFPRDSWVTVPGFGKGKINSAYPDGYNAAKAKHGSELEAESAGIVETIRTIHTLTGLHIDHYMQVSLLGFYRISEAIGGVSVCLNAAQNPQTDSDAFGHGYSGIDLPKGVSVIKGKQALAFVRQRHGLPNGDLDRIKRQQYFLKAAFQKIESAGVLLNPFKLRSLLKAVSKSLLTDPGLDLLSLARQFESLTSGKISFVTVPNNGPTNIYPDGVETSIVQINQAEIPAFVAQLQGKGDEALKKAKPATTSTVTVDVLNGTDVPHMAGRNATLLRNYKFKINTIDSTSLTPRTTVEYPPGKESAAKAVLRLVPGAAAVATPDVSRVTLILGTDGKQVTGAIPVHPKASSSAHKAPADPTHGLGCID
jgi:LCP family protein required for cell wall assembly